MGEHHHPYRGALLWAVQGVLVGGLVLLAGHAFQRERQLSLILTELGEMRGLVAALRARETRIERQVQRTKRQVDLANRPQVLDYSYSNVLPESTANLTVYDSWNGGINSKGHTGVNRHHTVSASWDGEGRGRPGHEEEESWNQLFEGRRGQRETDGHEFGVGEVLGVRRRVIPSSHRQSRVAQSGPTQGFFVEIPGQSERVSPYTRTSTTPPLPHPPTPSPSPTFGSTPSLPRASRSYKRPELKSLGTPDQPTGPSTAVQLEAEDPADIRHDGRHTHWRFARWARRLGAAASFPVSSAGEVGVPSPGLYLVYAQVSYLNRAMSGGFILEVNGRSKLSCEERRGTKMQISCYTGGLLYLEQGDKVSVKDKSSESRVNTQHGKTFFGIVKLTGDWI